MKAMLGLLAALGAAQPAAAAPVPETQRAALDLRRTTLVVRDMEASLRFYRDALGLHPAYDSVIRTPRDAATDEAAQKSLRLVLLRANDDYIGMLGLMQYAKPARAPRPEKSDAQLDPGDVVLVFNTGDVAGTFARAASVQGARTGEPPDPVTYPSYDGKGVIHVMFSSVYDPDGNYVELNQVLDDALH